MTNNDFELEYPTYDTNVCPTRENYWKAKLIVQRYETYQYNFNIYKDKPEGSIPRMSDRDAMLKDAITLSMSEGVLYGQASVLIDLIQVYAQRFFSKDLSAEYLEKLKGANVTALKIMVLEMHTASSMEQLEGIVNAAIQLAETEATGVKQEEVQDKNKSSI